MDDIPRSADRNDGLALRRDLKVKMAWAFAAKLAGLTLLWYLFFRGHV